MSKLVLLFSLVVVNLFFPKFTNAQAENYFTCEWDDLSDSCQLAVNECRISYKPPDSACRGLSKDECGLRQRACVEQTSTSTTSLLPQTKPTIVTQQGSKDPFPEPHINCNEVYDDQDFHSLRPFQASPCEQTVPVTTYAMCGNDLVATEKLVIPYNTTPAGMTLEGCTEVDGNQVCDYSFTNREIEVNVDLSQARLPIVGITEGPLENNSQQRQAGSLTNAQKTNEYVSWYMNGTTYRAEGSRPVYYEGYPAKPEGMGEAEYKILKEEASEIINFSGPIKKLLPFRVQQNERVEQIEKGTDLNSTPIERHDQIVGCTYNIEGYNFITDKFIDVMLSLFDSGADITSFFNSLGPIDYLIPDTATKSKSVAEHPVGPCYPEIDENGDGTIDAGEFDLLKWKPSTFLIPALKIDIEEKRLSDWKNTLPPKREDTDSFGKYWRDYKRWRGGFCISIGFLYVCSDDPGQLNPNWQGELFSFIPFSSTEDKIGEAKLTTAGTQPPSDLKEITDITFIADEDGEKRLYFPHMEESAELGQLLQTTFVPGADSELKNKWLTENGYSPKNTRDVGYNTNYCEPLESRTNPGDDLFGEHSSKLVADDTTLSGKIEYSGKFTCTFPKSTTTSGGSTTLSCAGFDPLSAHCNTSQCQQYTCGSDGYWIGPQGTGVCSTHPDCAGGVSTEPVGVDYYGDCTVELSAGVSLYTRPPVENEEIWERYVEGEQSIFKRFYPKVGVGAPVDEIKDIPAETNISYTSTANQTFAGNPDAQRPGSNAKMYIPHLGSVYDYFLKGIQKALRPSGGSFPITTIGQANSGLSACTYTGGYPVASSNLRSLIADAAQKHNVPIEMMSIFIAGENCRFKSGEENICTQTDDFFASGNYLDPGISYPFFNNCPNDGSSGLKGMFQLNAFSYPDRWNSNRDPGYSEVCSIHDTIYALANLISSYGISTSSTYEQKQQAMVRWVLGPMDLVSEGRSPTCQEAGQIADSAPGGANTEICEIKNQVNGLCATKGWLWAVGAYCCAVDYATGNSPGDYCTTDPWVKNVSPVTPQACN